MTPTNQKILCMVMDNKSVAEICEKFNLTRTQLKSRIQSIKKEGYRVDTMYSPNGKDRLFINYNSYTLNTPYVRTCDIGNNILIGLVADTHIGSDLCDMDSIKRIYDYFNNKGINFVFHLGDIVDGDLKSKSSDIESQVLTAILDYPTDSSIRNFIVLGNHDEDFVEKSGIDIGCALEHYRDDFISLGYADSFIKLANSSIKLVHKPNFGDCTDLDLAIGGHLHKYKFSCGDGIVKIVCPALSNVNPYRNFAGALMLKLNFDSSNLADLVLSQLMVIDGKIVETGENYYQYSKKR